MDYFREINAFYESLESKDLKAAPIALWHALAHICNKLGWPETFTATIKVLSVKTGMSEKTIERARNTLVQHGYITWKARGGSACPIYRLHGLWGKYDGQPVGQSVGQPVGQSVGQPVDINKPKEKAKDNIAHLPQKREIDGLFESVWALYPCKKGKAHVSDATKRRLFNIGLDALTRCIDRYKTDKPEWQDYQHGSTFFNGGYVDYLDENYQSRAEDDTEVILV